MPDSFMADGVDVRLKHAADEVVARFTPGQWRNIFTDIDSDAGLDRFLDNNRETSRAYMLVGRDTGMAFGWIYLCRHDQIMCDTVEFHGGAWSAGIAAAMLKFRASCLVIDRLLCLGVRVVSRAFRDNRAALRFLESLGFRIVRRRSRRPYVCLTLSQKRFYESPVRRRVMDGRR